MAQILLLPFLFLNVVGSFLLVSHTCNDIGSIREGKNYVYNLRTNSLIHISAYSTKKIDGKNGKEIVSVNGESIDDNFNQFDRDALIARAGLLRLNILKQQIELQKLERKIECCTDGSNGLLESPLTTGFRILKRTGMTFMASSNVLLRKIQRVRDKKGRSNKKYKSVGEYMVSQTAVGARIVSALVQHPNRLVQLVDPDTPSLVAHVPAIYARLDKLEPHVASILENVLNNRRHLASVEPYLDGILDRFDDIEPHLPWIMKNIDILAPYCGLLLKHMDELLLYASANEDEGDSEYALAEQLLPYLEYYVSRLDLVGPHLPLLRPHLPKLLKFNRIAIVTPHIDRLFSQGYLNLGISANLDIVIFWFGWALRVPFLPRLFFAIPGSTKIVSFVASKFPKRIVRGYCSGVSCTLNNDYGSNWNKLSTPTE